jgi:hypothetical protein
MPAPNSADRGQSVPNTHLKWDVFVTTDFAPGEHERPWPLISGLRATRK